MINGEGLIGKVAADASDGAEVSLITNSTMGVSARVGSSSSTGIIQPKVGEPNNLLLQYLPASAQPWGGRRGRDLGHRGPADDSQYPPGIPIGQITKVGEESAYKQVNVEPYANLHDLDVVQVLTSVPGGWAAGKAERLVSTYVPAQGGGGDGQRGNSWPGTGIE